MAQPPPWKKPIGYMNPMQMVNYLGTYGEMFVLHNGTAFHVTRIVQEPDYPGVWTLYLTDRHGKQTLERLLADDMWYVSRRDLVSWDDTPPDRKSPFQDL